MTIRCLESYLEDAEASVGQAESEIDAARGAIEYAQAEFREIRDELETVSLVYDKGFESVESFVEAFDELQEIVEGFDRLKAKWEPRGLKLDEECIDDLVAAATNWFKVAPYLQSIFRKLEEFAQIEKEVEEELAQEEAKEVESAKPITIPYINPPFRNGEG